MRSSPPPIPEDAGRRASTVLTPMRRRGERTPRRRSAQSTSSRARSWISAAVNNGRTVFRWRNPRRRRCRRRPQTGTRRSREGEVPWTTFLMSWRWRPGCRQAARHPREGEEKRTRGRRLPAPGPRPTRPRRGRWANAPSAWWARWPWWSEWRWRRRHRPRRGPKGRRGPLRTDWCRRTDQFRLKVTFPT